MEYVVVYEKSGTGWAAYVPDLPGCIATARTRKQVEKLIQEGIQIYLEETRESGEPIPKPSTKAGVVRV